ncbi:MAG TPA: hypothetical protein VFW23_18000 [Tepidisphaeraceae bacterium]|nr:hypothetical protein [Tepidisphaeraceae bacterium]
MAVRRAPQAILIVGLIAFSWPMMMLVHEAGHVIGALATGGRVQRVIWHQLVFSRTDVAPNPSPKVEVWAGPILGAALPALLAAMVASFRLKTSYLFVAFAGFCLLINGLYIGWGLIDPVGDAHEMIRLGVPRWSMLAFGLIATISGIWLLDRVSPSLGFGDRPKRVRADHAALVLAIAALVWIVGLVFGNRGT